MKIYFAGSIRGGRDDKEIYFKIIKLLSEYGSVLTEHIGKSELSDMGEISLTDEQIYKRDIAWINESDVVIAEVTRPSLGVGYEIAYAELKGKKLVCLFREIEIGKRVSAMISGDSNIEVINYTVVEELPDILRKIFKK